MTSLSKSWLHRLCLLILVLILTSLPAAAAQANIDDDRPDGNIFVVYAGNGSLVPSRLTLAQSRQREMPVILAYYLDDSQDSKQFAIVVSRVQEFYGRAASIIPVSVDSIPPQTNYTPEQPGYYYKGVIPQTVVLNQQGKVVYDGRGVVAFEAIDDVLRQVFGLLPRSESTVLKRRSFNEFNTELVEGF